MPTKSLSSAPVNLTRQPSRSPARDDAEGAGPVGGPDADARAGVPAASGPAAVGAARCVSRAHAAPQTNARRAATDLRIMDSRGLPLRSHAVHLPLASGMPSGPLGGS